MDNNNYEFFPESISKRKPILQATENQNDPMVWVKFFTPDSIWTWYVIEFGEKGLFFGLVEVVLIEALLVEVKIVCVLTGCSYKPIRTHPE